MSIRYKRLSYAVLKVSDVAASTRFYCDLVGLESAAQSNGCVHLRCSDLPQSLVLAHGAAPGIARIAFELESKTAFEDAYRHLSESGFGPWRVSNDETAAFKTGAALRFELPTCGLCIELHEPVHGGDPFAPSHTAIVRLGHLLLNVSRFNEVLDVLTSKLGFKVSDFVPDRIAFLRAFPNTLHHSFGLISSDVDGLNHLNFMVSDIDDVGRALNRMRAAGVPIVFGPGRHLPSGSIFLYFLDPDGMTAEYSFGMEEFGEVGARPARQLEPTPYTLDMWGSVPDARFGKVGAIARHP